ncbi:hypothetical protein [Micromonospora sp. NBC_00858]|uniref:hypothetical protein n=1 Tax=Micromonospora sp. NBC_00858 TaxID=2975979 RepID=UPI0038641B08|nr:hypothetical protein OG990_01465 [Micromonospora sp. NBC_00858]
MANNPPKPRTPGPVAEPALLDRRYAALVEELDGNMQTALDGLTTPLSDVQRAELETMWGQKVRPAVIKQLDALVGPVRPVIAEACEALNIVPTWARGTEKDYTLCQGDHVALVRRRGNPETPGIIEVHHPGCEKHAKRGLKWLAREEQKPGRRRKGFHSIMPLGDARREIRQQELGGQRPAGALSWLRRG